MSFNDRATYDKEPRYMFSGKDAELRDADGNLLCSVESWSARVSFQSATWQAIGAPIQQAFLTGYTVTVTITEAIVEDEERIREVFDFFHNGRHAPMWTFSSVLKGYDGSESRYVFRDCVPTSDLDLHNITNGEIIKRNWTFQVNSPPELQKILTIPE